MNSFYSSEELKELGFKRIGENVLISKKASFYSPETIEVGDNVRIDDFALLSGSIVIGNNVHISAYAALYACDEKIIIKDDVSISCRATVYSQIDDFSGDYMANAVMSDEFRNVEKKEVVFENHSIVSAGSVVLPGVTFEEGAVVGALSLVNESLEPWTLYAGIPCKKIKDRTKGLLKFEE